MKKTPISQFSKEEEKKELEELFGNIKKINRIRYIIYTTFALLYVIYDLIGTMPLPRAVIFLLFLIIILPAIWDLSFKKIKLKTGITSVSAIYFLFQALEVTIILVALHFGEALPLLGVIILAAYLCFSYYSYTRRYYSWGIIVFSLIIYAAVSYLEYLGILDFKDIHNIGINIARNRDVFIMNITTGTVIMLLIFSLVDMFSRKLRESLKTLTLKEKQLQEAKGILEIRVKERTEELETERASLEGKVKERTKELQERIDELEKFHKVTIGRELKMVELKEEIERLNKELEKHKS